MVWALRQAGRPTGSDWWRLRNREITPRESIPRRLLRIHPSIHPDYGLCGLGKRTSTAARQQTSPLLHVNGIWHRKVLTLHFGANLDDDDDVVATENSHHNVPKLLAKKKYIACVDIPMQTNAIFRVFFERRLAQAGSVGKSTRWWVVLLGKDFLRVYAFQFGCVYYNICGFPNTQNVLFVTLGNS